MPRGSEYPERDGLAGGHAEWVVQRGLGPVLLADSCLPSLWVTLLCCVSTPSSKFSWKKELRFCSGAPGPGRPQMARRGDTCFFRLEPLPERGQWAAASPCHGPRVRVPGPHPLCCGQPHPHPWEPFSLGKERVGLWMTSKGSIFERFHQLRVERASLLCVAQLPHPLPSP